MLSDLFDPPDEVRYSTIPGIPDVYKVGTDGSFWSCRKIVPGIGRCGNYGSVDRSSWTKLKPHSDGKYLAVSITIGDGTCITKHLHTLILTAFIGARPNGLQCRHLDGDPANCQLDNLRWGTPAENGEDMKRHGKHAHGERNGGAKLTEEQVKEIRLLHSQGVSYSKLTSRFGVGKSTISRIVRGTHWTRI